MIIFLLILIVLILLFGAGVVKGWIKGLLTFVLGGVLAVALLVWLANILGEDGAMIALGIGALALAGLSVWARSDDPSEREHKARIKRAQEQRRKRREEGKSGERIPHPGRNGQWEVVIGLEVHARVTSAIRP